MNDNFSLLLVFAALAWLVNKTFKFNLSSLIDKLEVRLKNSFPTQGVFSRFATNLLLILATIFLFLLALIGFYGGLVLVFNFGEGALSKFNTHLNRISDTEQLIVWLGILICFYTARKFWYNYERKSIFMSQNLDSGMYSNESILQKIKDIDADKIPTYPRITMYELDDDSDRMRIIFDSSDFVVINKAFRVYNSWSGTSVNNKNILTFKEVEYNVERVYFDFLAVFDDYSQATFGNKHTKVYEGKDTPYNIQIFIEVRKVILNDNGKETTITGLDK